MMTRTLITLGALIAVALPLAKLPPLNHVGSTLDISDFNQLRSLSPAQLFHSAAPSPSPSPDCDPVNNPSDCQAS